MFANLVTHHLYDGRCLPPYDALAYQYIVAGNGVFIRAETRFFNVLMPISICAVRGLMPLQGQFRLEVPRIPERLLATVLADARRAWRPDNGLNEVLYHFYHLGQSVQVKKPPQRSTAVSVVTTGGDDSAILCDLHSHGNMRAFWSSTDDADEQSARIFIVIGKLDTEPEIRMRVGVYGYWRPLPITAVFTGTGGFLDLHAKEKNPCLPPPIKT